MSRIRLKKPIFPITEPLRNYLVQNGRGMDIPIDYKDLFHFNSSISLNNTEGKDTWWETLLYDEGDREYIHQGLKETYALLKVNGDVSVIDHLYIDRVDLCLYANTRPIRVRIVNRINELFDYFYLKEADASRIYGMELEHLLSPNKINFLIKGNTLVEEHIPGIPGDRFVSDYLPSAGYNPIRVAKEFVKFNERGLIQLLGDMKGDNFVVEVVPDFDEVYFRMRAIDFDQECYEGNIKLYLPQFFIENFPIVQLGMKYMNPTLERQYQKEERSRVAQRAQVSSDQLNQLLAVMRRDEIHKGEHILSLREGLAELYQDNQFLACLNAGELVKTSLSMLIKYPIRKAGIKQSLP